MNTKMWTCIVAFCVAIAGRQAAAQLDETRSLQAGSGHLSVSVGVQYWKDYFRVRNLIARGEVDMGGGVRAHLGVRRREGNWQFTPRPDVDEAYLEWMRFGRSGGWNMGLNLKVGRVRYLRFPEPDYLSSFDQVPGIADLSGGPVTDYRGALFTMETVHKTGLGAHFGGIWWGFQPQQPGASALEAYLFARPKMPWNLLLEGRVGALAQRPEPLGRPAKPGANLFVGIRLGEFEIGGLLERLRGNPVNSGVLVRFRPSSVTKVLGEIGFDYARRPQGISHQFDIWRGSFGFTKRPDDDDELVGEIRARRVRTFWQQSFQRNEYEHRLSSSGITQGPGLKVVMVEKPWHLEQEGLVSPHLEISSRWYRNSQLPGQLSQEVVYRFYRKKSH